MTTQKKALFLNKIFVFSDFNIRLFQLYSSVLSLLISSLLTRNVFELSTINKSSKIVTIPLNNYENLGFALIYNNNLKDIKELENRSLEIYHKSLKKRSKVKILNPINGKYLIAEVRSNRVEFSNFYILAYYQN